VRVVVAAIGLVAAASAGSEAEAAKEADTSHRAELRWTAETPDQIVALHQQRATSPGAGEADVMASLAVIAAVSEKASYGLAERATQEVATCTHISPYLRGEALALARSLSANEGSPSGLAAARAIGIVPYVSLLGPLRDAGGGLDAREGPEATGSLDQFGNPDRSYAWGSVDASWRRVPAHFAQARGIPLNLFVHPRRESCTYVASKLSFGEKRTVVLRVASTGSVRLTFDGTTLGKSEEVHRLGLFDRIAASVTVEPGPHVLAAKVCSGALDDAGRVRLRVTDSEGRPIEIRGDDDTPGIEGTPPIKERAHHGPSETSAIRASADLAIAEPSTRTLAAEKSARPAEPRAGFGGAVETPLARVLRGARDASRASVDSVLASATLRTLAGADDLRSPRAPGQLDAVLQSRSITADRAAMAAWLTPSAASKSGRLFGALQLSAGRAQRASLTPSPIDASSNKLSSLNSRTSDPITNAFVTRQLIEQRLDAGLPDWAMTSLRGANLNSSEDDDAKVLEARVVRALQLDTLSMQSAQKLQRAFDAAPTSVSNQLLLNLLGFAIRHRAASDQARIAETLAKRGTRGDILVEAMVARSRADVVTAARDAFEGGLDDADEALAVARRVGDAGAHTEAANLYRTITFWSPNRPEAWAGLARELHAVSSLSPATSATFFVSEARMALERARALAPGNPVYASELQLRAPSSQRSQATDTSPPTKAPVAAARQGEGASTSARFTDDERWLTPVETILARRQKSFTKGPADVVDRTLHWMRAVHTHEDHRISQLIQYAREVVIPPRNQDERTELLPSEGDVTEILKARVHRRNGSIDFPVEENHDGARPRVKWPELDTGDVVEVVVRQWTRAAVGGRGDSPFYFMDFAGAEASHPIAFNEVIINSAPQRPLYVDVLHDSKDHPHERREFSTPQGRHIVHLTWKSPMLVPEEPLAPALSESVPVVLGSTFKTWSDFRAWYTSAIDGFTEPDDEVRRLARELTKGKTKREDKVRALFEFVADDIRYVNYVSGEWWLPNRPQQVLARREGDCDDKALLLITLLRSVGIEAKEVLVQTRQTNQPSVLLSKNAAVPMFDHGIAFLPGAGEGTFLDATTPQSRIGPLPSMDARGLALRIASDEGILHLPPSSPADHGSDTTWTLQLSADGSATLSAQEEHTGDSALWLRLSLSEAEARGQIVEDFLLRPWLPTVDVDPAITFRSNVGGGKSTVSYTAKTQGLTRRESSELVMTIAPQQTYSSSLASMVERTRPVVLPAHLAPSHQRRRVRVVAPSGYDWAALPEGGEVTAGNFGSARLSVSRDPKNARVIVVDRNVVFDQHWIATSDYAAWRQWLTRVDSLMRKEIRLVPARGRK